MGGSFPVRTLQQIACVCLTATSLVGCGGSGPAIVLVSGQVTMDDKPVSGASISFSPVAKGEGGDAGPGSYGKTDAEGRYTLRLVTTDKLGAVVGEHKIYITTSADTDQIDDATGWLKGETIPPPYRDGRTTFTVPAGGTDAADFHIQR